MYRRLLLPIGLWSLVLCNLVALSHSTDHLVLKIRRATFISAHSLNPADKAKIVRDIREHFFKSHGVLSCVFNPADYSHVSDEVTELLREEYQNRGYFKVEVNAQATPVGHNSCIINLKLNLINEGRQYRTGEIHWLGTKAFSESELLNLTPIRCGEIFKREKIAQALETARKLYAAHGYVNFTSIPNTIIDEDKAVINLNIEVDEGGEFRFGNLNIAGLDEDRTKLLQEAWDKELRGTLYSPDRLRNFYGQFSDPTWPDFDTLLFSGRRLNEAAHTIDIALTVDTHSYP